MFLKVVDHYHRSLEAKQKYDTIRNEAVGHFKVGRYEDVLCSMLEAREGYIKIFALTADILDEENVSTADKIINICEEIIQSKSQSTVSSPAMPDVYLVNQLKILLKPYIPFVLNYVTEEFVEVTNEPVTYLRKYKYINGLSKSHEQIKFKNSKNDILFQYFTSGGNNHEGSGDIVIGSESDGIKNEIWTMWYFSMLPTPVIISINISEIGFEYTYGHGMGYVYIYYIFFSCIF